MLVAWLPTLAAGGRRLAQVVAQEGVRTTSMTSQPEGRDWHAWHQQYDDPSSSLTRRLAVVRERLAAALADRRTRATIRLLSLCSGDGRDTVPVLAALAAGQRPRVTSVLVELDADLASAARAEARRRGLGVDVRTADAGASASWVDACPVDVLMLCGVFGNVRDDDVAATVAALPSMLAPGGVVLWTRGRFVDRDPSRVEGDPAEWVRSLFTTGGFAEEAFVSPDEAGFRVGVHRWPGPTTGTLPDRLFTFV
jgi:hypothetical protein